MTKMLADPAQVDEAGVKIQNIIGLPILKIQNIIGLPILKT